MPNQITPYVDGWLGQEREITVIPQPTFPFRNNPTPDTYSRLYERMYQVQPRLFLPKIANRTSWTNLLTYSEVFDNAAWTKTNLTVTADAGTAPDGQTTLDKLLESVTNGEHSVAQGATVTAAATEVSVFAVGGLTREWIRVAFTDSAATVFSAFFNITNGYIGTKSAGVTSKIIGLGNGQFRCVMQFTPATGAGTFKANVSSDGATISYAGNTANGVYLWGAQVTTGAETPYISTTTVTRAISAPDRDKTDPMAYLVDEDEPRMTTSESGTVRRFFSRIPKQQTVPGSMFVTKPDIPGTFPQILGDSLVIKPDATIASYQLYTRTAVSSDSGNPAVSYPSGGTYDITIGGDTAAGIAYNASAGTVQTALNALTAVTNRGSVAVTGTYNSAAGFAIAFAAYAASTIDVSSLTATGGTISGVVSPGNAQLSVNQFSAAASAGGLINGGTYTVTLFGQTTAAIPYNASTATLQAAINALSKVNGAATVTLWDGQGQPLTSGGFLVFTVTIAPLAGSVNVAALTPGGATGVLTATSPSHGWTLAFSAGPLSTRTLVTDSAHGIVTADSIYVKQGSSYLTIATGLFSVTGTTTITLTAASGAAFYGVGTITEVGKLSSVYAPGSALTRVNRVTDFYLPGVSVGITTAADIPLPAYQGDAASMLAAILAGTASINYQVGELDQWRGPILQRTVTTLNASQL